MGISRLLKEFKLVCIHLKKCLNYFAGNLNDDLIKAAQDGDTEKIGNFLEKGADLNIRDDLNRTPLMIAATFGHSEVVQFLVDKGANHSDQGNLLKGIDKQNRYKIYMLKVATFLHIFSSQ